MSDMAMFQLIQLPGLRLEGKEKGAVLPGEGVRMGVRMGYIRVALLRNF